jgi:creatinine amidohydrolase
MAIRCPRAWRLWLNLMRSWIPDDRFLPYLTWKQVEALDKLSTLIILPTAAIEQHGHHLPLATDTLLNNFILGRALELISPQLPAYALAPICYGKSNEHLGFPGTLSVSASTMRAVVRDVAQSVHSSGFKRLVIYNSHGGNSSLLDVMARDLRAEFGLQVFRLGAGVKLSGLGEQEGAYGYHAGEVETSLLLAATPDLVETDKYTSAYIRKIGEPGKLVPENGASTYAWLTRDISPSGVMGNPAASTKEKGERWREEMARHLAEVIEEMYHYRNLQKL